MVKFFKENGNNDTFLVINTFHFDFDIVIDKPTPSNNPIEKEIIINLSLFLKNEDKFWQQVRDIQENAIKLYKKICDISIEFSKSPKFKNFNKVANFFNIENNKKNYDNYKLALADILFDVYLNKPKMDLEKTQFLIHKSVFFENFQNLYNVIASFRGFNEGIIADIETLPVISHAYLIKKNKNDFEVYKTYNTKEYCIQLEVDDFNTIKWITNNSFITPNLQVAKSILKSIPNPTIKEV